MQFASPVALLNFPPAQVTHVVEALFGWADPGSQLTQLDPLAAYLPAGHSVHAKPKAEAQPDLQVVHLVPKESASVPFAQIVQLAALLGEMKPTGQEVQALQPGLEYLPGVQSLQAATLPQEPAAQLEMLMAKNRLLELELS